MIAKVTKVGGYRPSAVFCCSSCAEVDGCSSMMGGSIDGRDGHGLGFLSVSRKPTFAEVFGSESQWINIALGRPAVLFLYLA
jgi:hypothetical protein